MQHPEQQLEQLRRCQRATRPRRVPRAELRHQPRQLLPGAPQYPFQLNRTQQTGQRAQRLYHRRVGQDALPDVQAATGERHHAQTGGIAGCLGHQPGLAYPRLARDQHDSGLPGCCPLDRHPEQFSGVFGIKLFGNRGGTDEVREKRRDGFALLLCDDMERRLQLVAAIATQRAERISR